MKKRYAFIRFPNFCHQQRNIIEPHPLLVLVKEQHRSLQVSDLGAREYAEGVRMGMSLAEAKAIAPDLMHHLHDDEIFKREFMKLAQSASKFSPHVAIDEYGLLINITGITHLFGDEENMLMVMETFFKEKGFFVHHAIASHPLLAKALAFYNPNTIYRGQRSIITSLPVDALFMDHSLHQVLRDLGITSIGALMGMPKKTLAARFGLEVVQRLDELLGSFQPPPTYVKEAPRFMVSEHFNAPIRTHEHFVDETMKLVTRLLKSLTHRHLSLLAMTIVLKDTLKIYRKLLVKTSQPTNSLGTWRDFILLRSEQLIFADGIDSIKIIATDFKTINDVQKDFTNNDDHHVNINTVTDTLKARLGERAIFHLRITENHLPEQAVTKDFAIVRKQTPIINLPPRPLRLFDPPIPVVAISLLPDNPPAKIIWHHHNINVIHARGPERIEHAWWTDARDSPRDYYYIEDERGKRLWLYASGDPKRWFVHGVFI